MEQEQNTNETAPPEDALIILPVRNMVLFPGVILPLSVGRPASIAAAQAAAQADRPIGLLLQRDPSTEQPGPDDLHALGCSASVLRYVTAPDGTHHLICQGERRFRVREYLPGQDYPVARVEWLEDAEADPHDAELAARLHRLKHQAAEALRFFPQAPQELGGAIEAMESPAALADLIASFMDVKPEEKQQLLETLDLRERLDRVLDLLGQRLEVMRLSEQISQRTRETLTEQQRKHLLREQLRTIRQELGEDEGEGEDIRELRERLEQAGLPEEAHEQATRELARLERMPEASTEYSMSRTYLDWLIKLPWSVLDEERLDIEQARAVLEQDHYGLERIKRRILEYLAVRKLNPEGRSPILCFVGPPGVGKTSLGQSIAHAVGLKFVRASLGGVHDEAQIRGHRRTYVGALPGEIIQGINKAGTRNPVFMLDEMDKLGGGAFHGDPSAALLEVLDPEQNSHFRDNYLGVDFDLSKVLFIATANVLDAIPGPLRDRMEVIELTGYTEEEKVEIARRYLVARQLRQNGLKPEQCRIEDEALHEIVRGYTREAGARNLERNIGAVCRNVAVRIAEGKAESVTIAAADLHEILGARRFENETAMRTSVPGVATGLAWTPVGGDILFIESSLAPGKGRLILTGQLGEVMKESAQAALTLIKSRAAELDVPAHLFEDNDIHVHVPAGAIPKDGPSAGVAMFLSLVSLLTERTLPADLAMTGEISLRGLVLPVGGIKEKCVAAAGAGIRKVMLPARNRKDLEDIPESARKQLEFVWLERVDEALLTALGLRPRAVERAGRS